jgi:hypothetical protein
MQETLKGLKKQTKLYNFVLCVYQACIDLLLNTALCPWVAGITDTPHHALTLPSGRQWSPPSAKT